MLTKIARTYWGIPIFCLSVTMMIWPVASLDPDPFPEAQQTWESMKDRDQATPFHDQIWYLVVSMLATIYGGFQIIGMSERWMGWKKGDGIAPPSTDCDGGD